MPLPTPTPARCPIADPGQPATTPNCAAGRCYFGAAHSTDTARDVRLSPQGVRASVNVAALRRRGIKLHIPERADQIALLTAKSSAGGRPPAFDTAIYKQRNTVDAASTRSSSARHRHTLRQIRADLPRAYSSQHRSAITQKSDYEVLLVNLRCISTHLRCRVAAKIGRNRGVTLTSCRVSLGVCLHCMRPVVSNSARLGALLYRV